MNRTTRLFVCLAITAPIFIMSACAEEKKIEETKYEGHEEKVIRLPACTKLISISWKNDNLWYLTRPLHTGETPETYNLKKEIGFSVPTLGDVPVAFIESCPNPTKPNN